MFQSKIAFFAFFAVKVHFKFLVVEHQTERKTFFGASNKDYASSFEMKISMESRKKILGLVVYAT